MIKKYNVIGDIHGKDPKKYIKEGYINIFVGDYFDPYDYIPFEEMKNNFLYLMDEKMKNPDNIILLYGNHDFHYIIKGEKYSRYNNFHANDIKQLFQEFDDLFYGICYNASGRIVSHAGITNLWLKCKGIDEYKTIDSLVESVNNLWFDIPNRYNNFSFVYNGDLYEIRFSFVSDGGIKGAAHIGVIRAFEEENIKINYISGTSSGSIVASLYAMRI